ncbi:MAG: Zn-ribbon domain-containing OB-fold protein [Thalassovita sp.]
MSEHSHITAPEPTAETAPFWEAANQGRLVLKRCLDTGTVFYPPRTISPFTGQAKTDWIEASGTGTLYSFSVTKRQGTEHCIAYVELSEGPIILSALTECNFDNLEIGQPLRVVFVPSENGQMVPMFTAA